ncbi:MAG: efflux RND transporter periplasmic adaptor subunit [Xanthomonadales bacterium]
MKRVFPLILTAWLLPASWLQAADLELNADERRLLDIRVHEVAAAPGGSAGELTLNVRFAPDGEWVIKTPLPGIVHRVFVQQGDRVDSGQALLVVRSAEMVALQRDYLTARADVVLQRAAWARDERLSNAGSISERRRQETRYALDAAEAEYRGLRGRLLLAGLSEADLDALVDGAAISPDITLRAPAATIVLARPARLGDQLDGSELLVRLGEADKLMLQGVLASKAAATLQTGATLDWLEGDCEAELMFVSDVIDTQTQTVEVRARPNANCGLLPGQLTRWRVRAGAAALFIPGGAVVKLDGRDVAFVETTGGFDVRPVTVRNTGTGSWLVLAGLQPGERIAATGTAVLKGMSLGMGGGDD